MPKKVVLVGHCGPDSSYLRIAISKASKDIQILSADDENELSQILAQQPDLLLVNRELEFGFAERHGVKLIEMLSKQKPPVKMMLISNFPEAQQEAVKAGAVLGFGKREVGTPKVTEILQAVLQGPS